MILQTATLVQDYDWVYIQDEALDSSGEDFVDEYKAFAESSDLNRLKTKPGQKPVVFRLTHLRGMAKKALSEHILAHARDDGMISTMSYYYAARLALKSMRNALDDRKQPVEVEHVFDKTIDSLIVTERFMSVLNEVNGGDLVNSLGLKVVLELHASKNS